MSDLNDNTALKKTIQKLIDAICKEDIEEIQKQYEKLKMPEVFWDNNRYQQLLAGMELYSSEEGLYVGILNAVLYRTSGRGWIYRCLYKIESAVNDYASAIEKKCDGSEIDLAKEGMSDSFDLCIEEVYDHLKDTPEKQYQSFLLPIIIDIIYKYTFFLAGSYFLVLSTVIYGRMKDFNEFDEDYNTFYGKEAEEVIISRIYENLQQECRNRKTDNKLKWRDVNHWLDENYPTPLLEYTRSLIDRLREKASMDEPHDEPDEAGGRGNVGNAGGEQGGKKTKGGTSPNNCGSKENRTDREGAVKPGQNEGSEEDPRWPGWQENDDDNNNHGIGGRTQRQREMGNPWKRSRVLIVSCVISIIVGFFLGFIMGWCMKPDNRNPDLASEKSVESKEESGRVASDSLQEESDSLYEEMKSRQEELEDNLKAVKAKLKEAKKQNGILQDENDTLRQVIDQLNQEKQDLGDEVEKLQTESESTQMSEEVSSQEVEYPAAGR